MEFTKVVIPQERQDEIFQILEGLLESDYEMYRECIDNPVMVKELQIHRCFLELGILCIRKVEKALDIRNQFRNSHRKDDLVKSQEEATKRKISRVAEAKQRYCTNHNQDPKYEKLQIVREYETIDDNKFLVIGIPYTTNDGLLKFGGSSIISLKETPKLYEEVKKSYEVYKY